MNKIGLLMLPALALLGGCATSTPNMPLVFGQTHTVGLAIGASTADQGAELTLGYQDRNIAIIPVTVAQPGGANTQVRSSAGEGFEDALSVLGQFELDSSARGPSVGLGKFFATGNAAKTLADGFQQKLSH